MSSFANNMNRQRMLSQPTFFRRLGKSKHLGTNPNRCSAGSVCRWSAKRWSCHIRDGSSDYFWQNVGQAGIAPIGLLSELADSDQLEQISLQLVHAVDKHSVQTQNLQRAPVIIVAAVFVSVSSKRGWRNWGNRISLPLKGNTVPSGYPLCPVWWLSVLSHWRKINCEHWRILANTRLFS
jgi:hypothetical protein